MKVTVLKFNQNKIAVSAEATVNSIEQLLFFTGQLGYTQPLKDFVSDFTEQAEVTYRMELF